MAVCGASGFVAHPPMNIANATKAWTGHFIYATYSAARRHHLPCSTRSSYGLIPFEADRIMAGQNHAERKTRGAVFNNSVVSGCGFAVLCSLWLANSCLWDQALGKGWLPAFPRFPPLSGFRAGRLLESPLAKWVESGSTKSVDSED